MLKAVGLFLMMLCAAAQAQQPNSAVIYTTVKPLPCNGFGNTVGGDEVTFLENWVDGQLPSDIYINKTMVWVDGMGPIPGSVTYSSGMPTYVGSVGNIAWNIDPQQQHEQEEGFPAQQRIQPKYLKMIGYMELPGNGPRVREMIHNPPVRYSLGDAIEFAPECAGGTVLNQIYLLVWINAIGDLKDLPPYTYALNANFNAYSTAGGSAGSTSRNLVPATGTASTDVRCRISSPALFSGGISTTLPQFTVHHASICLQQSNSTCTAAPTELKFGKASGYTLVGRNFIWSDWTPFSNPTGAEMLAIASAFSSGNTNYWAYSNAGNPGAWWSLTDSWNTAAMTGTVGFSAGVTSMIDQCQIR